MHPACCLWPAIPDGLGYASNIWYMNNLLLKDYHYVHSKIRFNGKFHLWQAARSVLFYLEIILLIIPGFYSRLVACVDRVNALSIAQIVRLAVVPHSSNILSNIPKVCEFVISFEMPAALRPISIDINFLLNSYIRISQPANQPLKRFLQNQGSCLTLKYLQSFSCWIFQLFEGKMFHLYEI